jgi:ribosomal protein S18 acetylase RimI-like enzyme
MSTFEIRPLTDADREWVRAFMIEHWGDEIMVTHGQVYRPHEWPGFAAFVDGALAGLITYRIESGECEVLSFDSLREGQGIGAALLNAVVEAARRHDCKRVFLITTNDNTDALRFYQKRGFALAALRRNAIAEARKIKPNISLIGNHGIPIRDEIELAIALVY